SPTGSRLVKLLLGHVMPSSVVAPVQTPVEPLHGPSPVTAAPSPAPPTHVSDTLGSEKPGGPLTGSLCVSEAHTSEWPVSCCISTPASSAVHGTSFFCLAVL